MGKGDGKHRKSLGVPNHDLGLSASATFLNALTNASSKSGVNHGSVSLRKAGGPAGLRSKGLSQVASRGTYEGSLTSSGAVFQAQNAQSGQSQNPPRGLETLDSIMRSQPQMPEVSGNSGFQTYTVVDNSKSLHTLPSQTQMNIQHRPQQEHYQQFEQQQQRSPSHVSQQQGGIQFDPSQSYQQPQQQQPQQQSFIVQQQQQQQHQQHQQQQGQPPQLQQQQQQHHGHFQQLHQQQFYVQQSPQQVTFQPQFYVQGQQHYQGEGQVKYQPAGPQQQFVVVPSGFQGNLPVSYQTQSQAPQFVPQMQGSNQSQTGLQQEYFQMYQQSQHPQALQQVVQVQFTPQQQQQQYQEASNIPSAYSGVISAQPQHGSVVAKPAQPQALHVMRAVESSNATGKSGENNGVPSSSFRGVSWHKRSKKWIARIWDGNRSLHVGIFSSEVQAALAVDVHLKALGAETRLFNIPDPVKREMYMKTLEAQGLLLPSFDRAMKVVLDSRASVEQEGETKSVHRSKGNQGIKFPEHVSHQSSSSGSSSPSECQPVEVNNRMERDSLSDPSTTTDIETSSAVSTSSSSGTMANGEHSRPGAGKDPKGAASLRTNSKSGGSGMSSHQGPRKGKKKKKKSIKRRKQGIRKTSNEKANSEFSSVEPTPSQKALVDSQGSEYSNHLHLLKQVSSNGESNGEMLSRLNELRNPAVFSKTQSFKSTFSEVLLSHSGSSTSTGTTNSSEDGASKPDGSSESASSSTAQTQARASRDEYSRSESSSTGTAFRGRLSNRSSGSGKGSSSSDNSGSNSGGSSSSSSSSGGGSSNSSSSSGGGSGSGSSNSSHSGSNSGSGSDIEIENESQAKSNRKSHKHFRYWPSATSTSTKVQGYQR